MPARSSLPRLLPQIELPRFPDQCLSELIVLFRGDELESGAHRRCGRRRGITFRCESIIQSSCLAPRSLRNCPPRSVRFLIGSTVSFRLRKCGSTSGQLTFPRYTLMRFVHALDAIVELRPLCGSCLVTS